MKNKQVGSLCVQIREGPPPVEYKVWEVQRYFYKNLYNIGLKTVVVNLGSVLLIPVSIKILIFSYNMTLT